MKKRVVSCLVAALMILSLAGCSATPAAPAAAPAAPAAEAPAAEAPAAEGAWRDPAEITGTVVVYSPMDEGQMSTVEEIWYAHYPDCEIEWLSDSIGTLMTKIESEKSNPYADVVLGGLFESDGAKYHDLLEKYTASNAGEQTVEDPEGYYVYQDVQLMCLVVNKELEEKLGVTIEGYEDLLDPALQGYVILADPASTSSGFRQYTSMLELMKGSEFADEKAWEYIDALMANAVQTTSSSQVYKTVMDGEYCAGLTYESIIQQQLLSGADTIRIVYPKEGNTACANGSALVAGCKNRANAEALLEMMGTDELQKARAIENTARGTRKDFSAEGFASYEEIGVKPLDFDYLGAHKDELNEEWAAHWEENGFSNR